MTITRTTLFPPPVRDSKLSEPEQKYLFSLQTLHPLVAVDTSAGNVAIALPNAGLTSSQTGQSNQNQEISYVKTSADANTVTITGAVGGPQVLTTQTPNAGSCVRFKSDGTNWKLVGAIAAGGGGSPAGADVGDGPWNNWNPGSNHFLPPARFTYCAAALA